MKQREPIEQLERLYAELPTIDCQGKCTDSCGPILMSRLERRRIIKKTGHAAKPTPDLHCNLLAEGRCRVYSIRPALCRLYGVVESMACDFGCVPSRWMTSDEAAAWMKRVRALGGDDHRGLEEVKAAIERYQLEHPPEVLDPATLTP